MSNLKNITNQIRVSSPRTINEIVNTNLVFSFFANDINQISGKVVTITDTSGNNNDMTQGTTSRQADLVIDSGGYKALLFDNANSQHYLTTKTNTQASALTIVQTISYDNTVSVPAFSSMFKRNNTTITGGDDEVSIQTSNRTLRVQPYSTTYTSTQTINVNQKYVITYTRSVTGLIRLYLNMLLILEQQDTVSLSTNNVAYRFSGNPSNATQRLFVGNWYNGTIIHQDLQGEQLFKLIRFSGHKAGINI